MIRLCTEADSEWLMELGIECYPKFDVDSSRIWLARAFSNDKIVTARGDHCAAVAIISKPFWSLEYTFSIQFFVSRKTRFGAVELLDLLKFMNDMRKSMGYTRTYISSMLADLSPFIRKLGGKSAGTIWILEDACVIP